MVWEVLELNLIFVMTPVRSYLFRKGYKRGREVHEEDFTFAFYAAGIGTLIPPTFSLDSIFLCRIHWRLSSLDKRSRRSRSRFREVPSKRRRWTLYFFHLINKYVMFFFFPNHCSMYVEFLLLLYYDAYHIRVSCFTEHNLISYSQFGLSKVPIVL